MKHVSILVPKGLAILDTIIGSLNLFQMANNFHSKNGWSDQGLFTIDLVGITKEPHTFNRFFQVTPTKTIEEVSQTDLIIIPGLIGNMEEQLLLNDPFVEWIATQRIQYGAEVASLCR